MDLPFPAYGRCVRVWLILCMAVVFAFLISVHTALAAQKITRPPESSPDSNTAGLLNTEVVPKDSYQLDLTTGHLWYGSGQRTNVFTNVYAPLLSVAKTPSVSVGGKIRYCETSWVSCSLIAEVAAGLRLSTSKSKIFASLLQNNVALDFESAGRLSLGLGAVVYAERATEVRLNGFEDRMGSWINVFYDLAIFPEWSIGAGISPVIKSFQQYQVKDGLIVTRLGFGGGGLFHLRTQYSFTDWQLSAGGALLSLGGDWSLWPVLEVIWRKPESLWSNGEEEQK